MQFFFLCPTFWNLRSLWHEETIHCVNTEYVGNSWDSVRSCDPNGLKAVVAWSPGLNSRRWHHPIQHKGTHQIPAWDVLHTQHKAEQEEEAKLSLKHMQALAVDTSSSHISLGLSLWQQKSRTWGYLRIFSMGCTLSQYTGVVALYWYAKE